MCYLQCSNEIIWLSDCLPLDWLIWLQYTDIFMHSNINNSWVYLCLRTIHNGKIPRNILSQKKKKKNRVDIAKPPALQNSEMMTSF